MLLPQKEKEERAVREAEQSCGMNRAANPVKEKRGKVSDAGKVSRENNRHRYEKWTYRAAGKTYERAQ
jgi:hypothetical protein